MQNKYLGFSLLFTLLVAPTTWATPLDSLETNLSPLDEVSDTNSEGIDQVTSVSQLRDVQPTDWAFQALQSLVERYGCIEGYPDRTYRGNRAMTRYEFAAGLNSCLDRIQELIATLPQGVSREDLDRLRKLQEEFAVELATLRGRVDALEARTTQLEANQFSTTTKLNAEVITAIQDVFGDAVGSNSNRYQTTFAYRVRLNLETSFTGKDLLRTRLEVGNFRSTSEVTGTTMTNLNFDTVTENKVFIPHLLYRTPLGSSVTLTVGPSGVGFTDITDTITPPGIADDARGIPSKFGEYSPFFRQGGGGVATNINFSKNVILTLGYLAGTPENPTDGNGLFNGKYNAMAQLAFYGNSGAIGLSYSHAYAPGRFVNLTGNTGSLLAIRPFGDSIATSNDTFAIQGYYRFTPNFQIHAWGGYINAQAENSGLAEISNGRGGEFTTSVSRGSDADIWFGAVGMSFPDVGKKGNLPGILVGLPPRVTNSDVRKDRDTSYHVEAFFRFQVNDYITVTPGFWVIFNPENDSRNDTQYVGVIRTSFNF
ncbi:carbohydrate porin [Phormidium sp. LEGE 05292]|uniref:iron uptake porin n=1 Tax=[Phormidium] sp. LEGE 05292 TaxID=767427 RepID=UPI001880B03E|nr:iron uptake porin [Phormidium sp. LEGE 05292]MBE9228851.1 carbohydrate porin [Phormidium sp. LEGE 05292]